MAAVAEFVDVRYRRGTSDLLRDINFTVMDDERWIVVGPNGAGKTTLLQLMSGNLYPSEGIIGLLGEVLGTIDVFELRPRIGFTSFALAERIPKGERVIDVVLSAAYAVVGRWREEYDEIDVEQARNLLQSLRIDHLEDRTFGTLSEGERKRTQIARALMTDPELLLLDEPASGLDLAGREALVETLSDICLNPMSPATVLVTHQVEEIPVGITHALLLSQGQIVAQGPIEGVLTDGLMSQAYGLNLKITHDDGRWQARSAGRRG